MGLGEALASHGQDEQSAEDVRQAPAGHGQGKQDPEGARQAPAGCRQSRVGPEPRFLCGSGIEYIQEIHLYQEI